MFKLTILVAVLNILEIIGMWKEKRKKDIAIYIILSIITLFFGYYYISNPYERSFSDMIVSLLKVRY